MRKLLALSICLLSAGVGSAASADGPETTIARPGALRRACRVSERSGPRELYAVELSRRQFRFARYDEEAGLLPVDTRRNIRLFRGAAELFPSDLETMGFIASPERARQLLGGARAGARLRVGFFLGFDGQGGTLCLVRSFGVTTVRMDVAFIELIGRDGRVLAREDTERLRAWMDDTEREEPPGHGPRGAAGVPSVESGVLPESWTRTMAQANGAELGSALTACHASGVRRGAAGSGQVIVRVEVEPRSGAVLTSEVELSSIGEEREGACIARAFEALRFPGIVSAASPRVVLRIPVRLAR